MYSAYFNYFTFVILLIVAQVAQKRWRLEINYSQDAFLMLSSMNMPDGVQVFS